MWLRLTQGRRAAKWIGPCQVLAATLTLSQPGGGGQIMPTLYWGPWLAKIRRGDPVTTYISRNELNCTANLNFGLIYV